MHFANRSLRSPENRLSCAQARRGPTNAVCDEAGDVTQYTAENGSLFQNTFDPLGRKTAVAVTPAAGVGGTTAQAFQFDGLSRATFAQDSAGGAMPT